MRKLIESTLVLLDGVIEAPEWWASFDAESTALSLEELGMGAIFAPLATMRMRAAPPALAGAASGVLNTGRQLGATLGGAITGAVLASQLAISLQARAVPAAQRGFVAGFVTAARSGLQVGRGLAGSRVPAGTPAALVPRLEHPIHDVFARAYIAAMHPTLAVSVAVLLAGAAACLLLRRGPAVGGIAAPSHPPARARRA